MRDSSRYWSDTIAQDGATQLRGWEGRFVAERSQAAIAVVNAVQLALVVPEACRMGKKQETGVAEGGRLRHHLVKPSSATVAGCWAGPVTCVTSSALQGRAREHLFHEAQEPLGFYRLEQRHGALGDDLIDQRIVAVSSNASGISGRSSCARAANSTPSISGMETSETMRSILLKCESSASASFHFHTGTCMPFAASSIASEPRLSGSSSTTRMCFLDRGFAAGWFAISPRDRLCRIQKPGAENLATRLIVARHQPVQHR
jgi:hypothetical protein